MRLAHIAALVILILPSWTHAVELLLEGDRMTLVAREADLGEVLQPLADAGVRVQVDPTIRKSITTALADEKVERVLESILDPLGYVVVWDVVRGPLGDLPRLAEVQVFRQGERNRIQPLAPDDGNFKVARGPAGGPEFVADEILVAVKRGTTLEAFRRLLAQIGGTIVGSIPELGVYRIRLRPGSNVPALVADLLRNAMIDTAEPNYVGRLPSPAVAGDSAGDAARPVNIPAGAARLAILDSGLLSDPALGNAIVSAYDAVQPDRAITDPKGHGTQMALLGSGAITPAGLTDTDADGTPIIAIRAFDDNGVTSNFALMRAVEHAVESGARVMNVSWGTETSSEFVKDAMAYANSKGIVVVAAAGNEPTGRASYPASYPNVVSVAALDESGNRWENSNYGSGITVAAPGVADLPVGHDGPPGSYAGTSIASVVVARELASYFSAHPQATKQEALKALASVVTDAGDKGRDNFYGFGALDAAAIDRLRGM